MTFENPLGRAGECDQGHIGVGKPAVTAHFYYALPNTPYAMWIRGELAEHLHLPKDGARVEVVGSEIVVSPGPALDHNLIVGDIQDRFAEARGADSEFPWRCVQTTDLDLVQIRDGYVPDLLVITNEVATEVRQTRARHLLPGQVGLVVEVASRSNAANDREPSHLRPVSTKRSGSHRRVGVLGQLTRAPSERAGGTSR